MLFFPLYNTTRYSTRFCVHNTEPNSAIGCSLWKVTHLVHFPSLLTILGYSRSSVFLYFRLELVISQVFVNWIAPNSVAFVADDTFHWFSVDDAVHRAWALTLPRYSLGLLQSNVINDQRWAFYHLPIRLFSLRYEACQRVVRLLLSCNVKRLGNFHSIISAFQRAAKTTRPLRQSD